MVYKQVALRSLEFLHTLNSTACFVLFLALFWFILLARKMLSVLFFPTLSLLSVAFASLTPADLSGLQNIVSGNGFIKFPVQTIQNTTTGSHRKRQDSLILTNSFTGTFYVVSCMTAPIRLDSN